MTLGISAGTAALIGGGLAAAGSVAGAVIGANGAQSAANTQANAANAGIAQQNYEFNTIQGLLSPYVQAGTNALSGYNWAQGMYQNGLGQYGATLERYNNLTGANGAPAQQQAISGLTSNPLYTTSMQLGQQAILANASATGGLRGGNTNYSLGYLPNQVLTNTMQTQLGNLGSSLGAIQGNMQGYGNLVSQYGNLVNVGENAAAGTGQAAQNIGNNITNLTGQIGAAQAGATLAGTNATTGAINNLTSSLGQYLNSGSGSGSYSFALPAYLNAAGASGISGSGALYGTSAGMFN